MSKNSYTKAKETDNLLPEPAHAPNLKPSHVFPAESPPEPFGTGITKEKDGTRIKESFS